MIAMLKLCRSKKPSKDVSYSLTSWFHSLVVGPGLGKDPVILQNVKEIIQEAKHLQKNLVIDAVSSVLALLFSVSYNCKIY